MQSNKDSGCVDSRPARAGRYLRKWLPKRGHRVHVDLMRGVAYGLGSGAVSLLVLWVENHF